MNQYTMIVMLHGVKRSLSIAKKIIIILVVFFSIISLFFYFTSNKKTLNSANSMDQIRKEIYDNINDPKLNSTPQGKASVVIYKSYLCAWIGEACTDNPQDGDKNFSQSLIGKTTNLTFFPYSNPPASGVYWAYSGLQNAGFTPKTYAAEGIGFSSIKPLMAVWKVMRDTSYMLLVLVIVLIGFMIMFRMKLNPQTVLSMENALPKIVISLLYITFSFAIAGFLIDFMYVLIVLGISVLSQADPGIFPSQTQQQYINANFGHIWDGMFPVQGNFSQVPLIGGLTTLFNLGSAIVGLLPSFINDSIRVISGVAIAAKLGGFLNGAPGMNWTDIAKALDGWCIVGTGCGHIGSAIKPLLSILTYVIITPLALYYGAGWIIGIVILLTMLLLLFRIFFMLFATYLKIILLIVFSPLFMLAEAIPGKSGFSYWFKNLLAEIMTFPIVIFILVLGKILVNLYHNPVAPVTNANNLAGQPTLWQPPFLYGIDASTFSMLLGMGIIFMIPDIVKISRELMGVKGLPLGLKIGTFFGGATAGAAGGIGMLGQFHTLGYGINTLFGQNATEGGILKKIGGIFGKK